MERSLSWVAYVEEVEALCHKAARPGFEPEQLAEALHRLSADLDLNDEILVGRFETLSQGQEAPYVTQPVLKTPTCGIMLVSLVAEGSVGLHDHPEQIGFIVCCRGQMTVDAYDATDGEPLSLRRTARMHARPGDCVSLTPTRGNIHRLDCTQPTWLVDVFAPPLTEEARAHVRSFVLGEEVGPGEYLASLLPRPSSV